MSMTDEQIKQNAELYAELLTAGNKEHYRTIYTAAKEGYETGAHSRNEEIKELEKKVSALETVIVTARTTISTQETIIKDIRNPWISVEERLPPRDVALVFPTHSIPVIGMIDNSTDRIHTGMRYDYSSKEWCYGFTPMRKYGVDNDLLISGDTLPVTHWMPIPKLKKGE